MKENTKEKKKPTSSHSHHHHKKFKPLSSTDELKLKCKQYFDTADKHNEIVHKLDIMSIDIKEVHDLERKKKMKEEMHNLEQLIKDSNKNLKAMKSELKEFGRSLGIKQNFDSPSIKDKKYNH